MFLIYVKVTSQTVKSNLFRYADDSCPIFQSKRVIEIEKKLNRDLTLFVDNRLSIHFGQDKTKYILIASKRKLKKVPNLNITYEKCKSNNIQRSYTQVAY